MVRVLLLFSQVANVKRLHRSMLDAHRSAVYERFGPQVSSLRRLFRAQTHARGVSRPRCSDTCTQVRQFERLVGECGDAFAQLGLRQIVRTKVESLTCKLRRLLLNFICVMFQRDCSVQTLEVFNLRLDAIFTLSRRYNG